MWQCFIPAPTSYCGVLQSAGLPYLLRLLTAMHTTRINASAKRAATMISHSGETQGRGRECVNLSRVILQFHRCLHIL